MPESPAGGNCGTGGRERKGRRGRDGGSEGEEEGEKTYWAGRIRGAAR